MKNKLSKISLLLAICIVLSTFAACGGKQSKDPEPSTVPANESSSSTSTQGEGNEADTEPVSNKPSWELDTSPVTLDWFINLSWFGAKWDAKNALTDKLTTEKTGVTINAIAPVGDNTTQLNVMIASNNLPDILTLENTDGHLAQLEAAGKLHPLFDLADKYAPELKRDFPDILYKWHQYSDNKLYYLSNWYCDTSEINDSNIQYYASTNANIIAREDIMNQLGIKPEDFNTQDGMIAALKKVKDANITYNGQKMIPLLLQRENTGALSATWQNYLPQMFGIPMEDSNGNYLNQMRDPKYLELLQFGSRLFREGYASPQNFTYKSEQIDALMSSGRVFCYMADVADVNSSAVNLYKSDQKAKFVGVGPLHAKDNAEPCFPTSLIDGWLATGVPTTSKHPDRAIRFLSFLWSKEGTMLERYGVEGVTYNIVDGKAVWTQEYQDAMKDENGMAAQKYGIQFGGLVELWTNWGEYNARYVDPYGRIADEYYDTKTPYIALEAAFEKLDPSGDTSEGKMLTQVNSYISQMIPKILLAKTDAEVEEMYNEMIEHCDKLGMGKIDEIRNANFQKSKEKLGEKFAWPANNQ